ncbi:hypothetical protein ACFOQN_07045, partial [Neisseria musculi]
MELFKRYLKSGFIMPLQATLRSSGLLSDVQTADGCIGKRLSQTADAPVHGTTGEIPNIRLIREQEFLVVHGRQKLTTLKKAEIGSLVVTISRGVNLLYHRRNAYLLFVLQTVTL